MSMPPPPAAEPPRAAFHELGRIRAAAIAGQRRYPGPVGELLKRELTAHADLGYLSDRSALMRRLVDDLLRPPAQT